MLLCMLSLRYVPIDVRQVVSTAFSADHSESMQMGLMGLTVFALQLLVFSLSHESHLSHFVRSSSILSVSKNCRIGEKFNVFCFCKNTEDFTTSASEWFV